MPTVVVGRGADATTTCVAVTSAKSFFTYQQSSTTVTVNPSGTDTITTSSIPVTCSNSVLSVSKTIQVAITANTDHLGWDHDTNPATVPTNMNAALTLRVPAKVEYTLPTPIKLGTQASATASMTEPSPAGKYLYDPTSYKIHTTANATINADAVNGLLIKVQLLGCSKSSLFTLNLTITQNTAPTFDGIINNQQYVVGNGV